MLVEVTSALPGGIISLTEGDAIKMTASIQDRLSEEFFEKTMQLISQTGLAESDRSQ